MKEIWTMSSKDVMQFNAIWDYAFVKNSPFSSSFSFEIFVFGVLYM